jgi:hypothetical protein
MAGSLAGSPGLVIGAGPKVGAAPPDATCLTRNTLRICVDPPPPVNGGVSGGQQLNLLTAQIAVPGQTTIVQVEIGLTGSGSTPLEIFDSLRPTNPAPVTGPAVTIPDERVPAGSTAFDYGLIRLWLPPGWTADPGTYCGAATKQVFVGTEPPCMNSDGTQMGLPYPTDFVWISPRNGPAPASSVRLEINGLSVWRSAIVDHGVPAVIYDLPGQGVQLEASGPGADAVAATIEESSLAAVVSERPQTTPPTGWKVVHYGQVRLEVPQSWPVTAATDDFQFFFPFRSPPKLFEGVSNPSHASFPPPIQFTAPADGVWIAPGDQTQTLPTPRFNSARPGGLSVTYSSNPLGYPEVMMLIGSGPSLTTVVIGIGVDPATAEEIIDSLS